MLSTKEQAQMAAHAASSKNAQDIIVLDLQGISLVADYFIISSGRSDVQVKAIAHAVEEKMEELGLALKQREGYEEGRWILLDYADMIVHVFLQEARDYYQLERLWADASEVSCQPLANP